MIPNVPLTSVEPDVANRLKQAKTIVHCYTRRSRKSPSTDLKGHAPMAIAIGLIPIQHLLIPIAISISESDLSHHRLPLNQEMHFHLWVIGSLCENKKKKAANPRTI